MLPPYLRIIQGDGVDLSSVDEVRKKSEIIFIKHVVKYICFVSFNDKKKSLGKFEQTLLCVKVQVLISKKKPLERAQQLVCHSYEH